MDTRPKTFPQWGLTIGVLVLCASVFWAYARTSNGTSLDWHVDPSSLSSLSENEIGSCVIDRQAAFEQTTGPVAISTSPTEHPDTPKLSSANNTAWEQWEFDGTSDSADSSILINFARDPSYHFFKQGNLRVELFLMLDGRLVLQDLDFVDDSIVVTCPNYVAGIWTTSDRTYRFEVPTNMSGATVQWATQRSSGLAMFQSLAFPHLARGALWPDQKSAVQLTPSLNYAQPIAGGRMEVVHRTASRISKFSGGGGHTRLWATAGWFEFAAGFHQVRAAVGSYVFSYWQHDTRGGLSIDQTVYSAYLFQHGKLLMGTNKGELTNNGDEHVLFTDDLTGSISGFGASGATGQTIDFVSPHANKTWRFHTSHQHRLFDMDLGDHKGISGFTAIFQGGDITKPSEHGSGFVEYTEFPTEFKQWQIWAVYVMHLLKGLWDRMSYMML